MYAKRRPGKVFGLESRLKTETKRLQDAESLVERMTAERGAWEETFAAQERHIKKLANLSDHQVHE